MLEVRKLSCTLGGQIRLHDVNLRVIPGEVLAVMGPNGAGKSTLLSALACDLSIPSHCVSLNGRDLKTLSTCELARERAVLPQQALLRFGFQAREVVRLGRYAWPDERVAAREAIVDSALLEAGASVLASRQYMSLSAGERARVQYARVLAQIWEPVPGRMRLLLLDEPTANLDLVHQHAMLLSARRMAQRSLAVVMTLHDPNLALMYADRAMLLREGRVLGCGAVGETLAPQALHACFGLDMDVFARPDGRGHWIAPRLSFDLPRA